MKEYIYKGHRIVIKHMPPFIVDFPDGYYCGYVIVPRSHRLYGVEDIDKLNDELSVHGVITYADFDVAMDDYVIGFDCGHMGDDIRVQDAEFALKECKRLVDQLIGVEK